MRWRGTISKRRVRLGSGLDLNKLADTIRQITLTEGQTPDLICNAPGHDHGWVHLSARTGTQEEANRQEILGWVLTLGYPSERDAGIMFEETGLDLPDGTHTISQTANVYVKLLLPSETSPTEIAHIVRHIMVNIQHVEIDEKAEIALEYD